ncbi:MAG: hypothetical protein WBM62_09895 [Crocosphaera sp.]
MTEKSEQKQELFEDGASKDRINLSPEEIADPINKNLKDRYQGLIEKEELDTLNVWESNEIIKGLDAEKSPVELNNDTVIIDDPTQKILGILPSANLTINGELQPIGSLIFSPIPIALMTLVSGIILFQKKEPIYQFILGENGVSEQILEKLGLAKPKVSDTAIFLHNRAMQDAKLLAKSAKVVDEDKFGKTEFLMFAKLKFCVQYERKEYEGYKHSIQLFKSALKAQKSYVTIDQIESMCQGTKQKEFYNYVYQELENIENIEKFNENISRKLTDILPQVKTDEGKYNLQVYAEELGRLSEDRFSLQLFSLFSKQQLQDFLILKSVAEIISTLKEQDVINLKALTCLVMVHYDDFESLGKIINITGKQSSPDTYARIIQYIALEQRHEQAYDKFEKLLNVLRQWYPFYQSITKIREEYPQKDYRKPKDFTEEIPGIELYHKYKNYLTDQQTGYTYIDFGEEVQPAI